MIPDGSGFKQHGELFTWQKVKDTNQIDKLPPYLRVKYDNWLATQGG